VDDSKYDVTSTISMRMAVRWMQAAWMIASKMQGVRWSRLHMMKVEEKRGGIAARAVVFRKPSSGKGAELWQASPTIRKRRR